MGAGTTRSIAHFNFIDPDAGDDLFIGVTVVRDGLVGLAVSLEQDGDYYIFFGPDEAAQLIAALQRACDVVVGEQAAREPPES